ncbi:MAG: T9SS type A sorting domain-containing protein, partial [Bacteroidales bacterium]
MDYKKQSLMLAIWIFSTVWLAAQTLPGSLLLVGGGSEDYGDWSDEPYQWAVDQSANKRVAVITYDHNPTQWIPNYFEHLGAIQAKNFSISSQAVANQQSTYDSLITYDMIFFKGGDQAEYYDLYKNTLTEQAVEDVFNSGGVIGGTSAGEMILSEILFTAQNGTVYPEEAIEDPNNYYMTLADDFLNLMPGMVFDSHVVERARFARLIGFMGHWKLNHGEDITGIGVDDKTAFCIGKDMKGTAYGTGAVNIYRPAENNTYAQGGTKLLASHLLTHQLLHNCSIDLNTFEAEGFETFIQPKFQGENYGGYIIMSGSDNLNDNLDMIARFAEAGNRDSVLIVTGNNTALAQGIQFQLEENNSRAEIMQAIAANGSSAYYAGKAERLTKIVFAGNDYEDLMEFLVATEVGALLHEKLQAGEKTTAFVGGDSRFAGGTVLINYDQEYASYDGLLEFGPGIALLQSMIIMPGTFESSKIRENAAAGVPYGMLLDSLNYGIWLHGASYAEYKTNDDMETTLTAFGQYPMIFMENEGTPGGFSRQSAVNSGEPRDVAGFELFHTALMDESMTKVLGFASHISPLASSHQIKISPNPATEFVEVSIEDDAPYQLSVVNASGNEMIRTNLMKAARIDISSWPSGLYAVVIRCLQ